MNTQHKKLKINFRQQHNRKESTKKSIEFPYREIVFSSHSAPGILFITVYASRPQKWRKQSEKTDEIDCDWHFLFNFYASLIWANVPLFRLNTLVCARPLRSVPFRMAANGCAYVWTLKRTTIPRAIISRNSSYFCRMFISYRHRCRLHASGHNCLRKVYLSFTNNNNKNHNNLRWHHIIFRLLLFAVLLAVVFCSKAYMQNGTIPFSIICQLYRYYTSRNKTQQTRLFRSVSWDLRSILWWLGRRANTLTHHITSYQCYLIINIYPIWAGAYGI